jgi:alkylhydroperoxidase/carboxymuconolactone decarboxylase family protein YurZ
VTPAEIAEVLLQVAIYAGVPAAVDSFRIANEVLSELGLIGKPQAAPGETGAA